MLDNKIFRVLLVLVCGIVACFFLVGFQKDELQVVWGLWSIRYEDVFSAFGQRMAAGSDLQGLLVQRVQSTVVETLCGSIGMIVCLSATAFFLPRMLEKGAADLVFAKPVSRFALMLSRYVSGLLFVGILAVVGTFGIWLGLLVVSGYNDPGVLWGAVTLIYLFGILHAFSCCVGVFTRSTVAAILMSVVFFMGTGCVHSSWLVKSFFQESEAADAVRAELEHSGTEETGEVVKPTAQESESPWIMRMLMTTLDSLHYALPKTSDADYLTKKLRKAVEGEPWRIVDDDSKLSVTELPEGFEIVEPSGGRLHVDASKQPIVFVARGEHGEAGRIEIARKTRIVERPDTSGKGARTRKLSTQMVADALVEHAKRAEGLVGDVAIEKTTVDGLYALAVHWTAGGQNHTVHVMTSNDWALEIATHFAVEWKPTLGGRRRGPPEPGERGVVEEQARLLRHFLGGVRIARQVDVPNPEEWYEKRFTWSAPLSSNIAFSIGSSLLFIALMLGCAWWKLRRIEF
ncbi:MAG: ABC transporter permease [Planctomycetes bacterium]|nr:ABC transporter permease [Planctomycetota bacterium]